ncbi:hypothetical protein ABB37_08342 [Leptomonas pyrrhocoris]|uniref:Uncharacterized protein n=1 Tax=Leptomonas pyrrhocoris TaxID=157538 RepID=A0A0M9FTU0_LEPPY|nr:hypothetical protein ABB37_08342 [Leptomonas pyrrhocoris]KPA75827.1 hypothetical protein ABB37_08342 [Leptomonas pyrrhocoris]|eukprot:XP_015654266.1 hypothetical protein ABB37_08342 [Leptomonas pyrrhocoris]
MEMTSFSRSALEILQAAEEVLTQPRHVRSQKKPTPAYAYKSTIDYNDMHNGRAAHQDPNCNGHSVAVPEASTVRELQSQLSRAMRELIELRAELAAERDRRNDTLAALGKQWKEEVMVVVHRRDSALQSDVAEVEEKLTAQWRESNESCVVLRRQLEEAVRAAKVRDTDRFQLREELQETSRQMDERVEVALAQSTAARADCSRQLEQERAALAQRLDAELLRLVEMRRADQRALQEAREALRQDGQRMRGEVQRAVQEVWESSAAALIKTATEPVEQLRAELRQCRAAVQSAEEKVADCVRSCQAECRLNTTTAAERLHALESKEAVATSRIDRAERRADGAYETVHRMESAVQGAKDAAERAQLQAAGALERTQKVEHALSDRDARLLAVESNLHAVSTAEGLKAEVEACKRQAGRLESRMDATGALCERAEQLADKTVRQVSEFSNRVSSCEKSMQRGVAAVQGVQESMEVCQADCQQIRAQYEVSEGVVQRHGQLMTQLEQRIMGQENRLGLWRQQQEQHARDQQTAQREMTERAEVMHATATRAQQVSSDARAEVSRLERRVDDVDRALTSASAEVTAVRAAAESLRTQGLEMQRQLQQQEDQLQQAEARVLEVVGPRTELEHNVAQRFERSESHAERLGQKLAQCERKLQEMGGRVQDYLNDAIQRHVGESQRQLLSALSEGLSRVSERVSTVESTVTEVQARSGDMPSQVQSLQKTSSALQRSLQTLEEDLQALRGHVDQLSLHAEGQSGDHQQLGAVRQEVARLTAVQQRLQQDLLQLQEMMRTLREVQLAAAGQPRDPTLSQLGGSQAQTASTEIARTTEADSSSPSARVPTGTGQQSSPHTAAIEPRQPTSAAVTPPLVASHTKMAPTLQAQQDRQRASSSSTNGGSKDSSVERPPSHLSGVSSVRPAEEEVAQLHSVAEPAAGTASSPPDSDDDDNDRVDALQPNVKSYVRSPQRTGLPSVHAVAIASLCGAAETVEQLSAPVVSSSVPAPGPVNTSHPTVIRSFATVDTASSDSDIEVEDLRPQSTRARAAAEEEEEEHADDASSELTTAVTLTSEEAVTPTTSGSRRTRPATAQRRTVAMAAAWGQPQPSPTDSPPDHTPLAPPSAARPANAQEGATEEVRRTETVQSPASNDDEGDGDSDAVQALIAQSSYDEDDADDRSGDGLLRRRPGTRTQGGNAWATTQRAAAPPHPQQPAGAGSSVPAPRRPQWDDWDEEDAEDDGDGDDGRSNNSVVEDVSTPAAPAHCSLHAGAAMATSNIEEVEEVPIAAPPQPSATSANTSASSASPSQMAATTVHHRSAGAGAVEELRATERRIFVGAAGSALAGSPEPRYVVPRHGQNTTSSSSSSAERAEALGLRTAGQAAPAQRSALQVRQYSSFDDSSTSDDD